MARPACTVQSGFETGVDAARHITAVEVESKLVAVAARASMACPASDHAGAISLALTRHRALRAERAERCYQVRYSNSEFYDRHWLALP